MFRIAQGVAGLSGVALGVWQIYVIATLIYPEWGVIGLIVGYVLFPLTLIWAPLYSGLALGDWAYLLFYPASFVIYGANGYLHALSERRAFENLPSRGST
jgi:hypothetical protein